MKRFSQKRAPALGPPVPDTAPDGAERPQGEGGRARAPGPLFPGGLLTSFSISARDLMVIPKRSKGCI